MHEPGTYYATGKQQTHKAHIVGFHETLRKGKRIETDSQLVVAEGWVKSGINYKLA